MTILRPLLGMIVAVFAAALAFAPTAWADPVSDAVAALGGSNLYVGDPAAQLDQNAVRNALDPTIKIAVLPASAGEPGILATQIGRDLDPSGSLTVGVVAGRTFSAASSKYRAGYAAAQARAAVADNKSQLQAGGDHPDLTAMLTDFAHRMQSGPLVSGTAPQPAGKSGGTAVWPWLVVIGVLLVGGVGGFAWHRRRRTRRELDLARSKVLPYYDRLASEVNTLDPKDNPKARQALADASERFTSAGSQLAEARTVTQYGAARRTVLEGLHAARTARTALGIDPGPDLPPVEEPRGDQLSSPQQVTVQGQQFQGYPAYTPGAPYYYGGGYGVPGGWYSTPFWETLLLGSVLTGGFGGWGGGWGGGGYDRGYQQGYDAGQSSGQGGDWSGGGGGGDWGGGGGDWGGGGGDWGGGGGSDSGGSW